MTTNTAIFYDSTPADNYCAPWRCVSTEAAVAAARSLAPEVAADAYATHETKSSAGAERVWVGLRDNRDAAAHAERITALAAAFREAGHRVRIVKHLGHVMAIRLTDPLG